MSSLSPEPDWLFLPRAPLTIATGDAVNRWTFLDHMKFLRRSFQPAYQFDNDQVLSRISIRDFEIMVLSDVNRFAVTYEGHWYFDAPFWDFEHLARTDRCLDFNTGEDILAGVSSIWRTAIAVVNQELARGRWKIMARSQGITSPLIAISSDMWMHFEITDWLRGTAKSSTGETLHSIHLAPSNYALNSDPEGFKIAHPESVLVGGKLVPNLSLYSLRTAADHPQDIWRLAEPESEPEEPQDELTEASDEASHGLEAETDAKQIAEEQNQATDDTEANINGSSSIKQEKACERHLTELMRKQPTSPIPKKDCWEETRSHFPGVSKKGFERAWAKAIAESGALRWRKPGRRKRS